MTLCIKGLYVTLSITMFCHYVESCDLFIVMLSVIMMFVVMLGVIMLSVVALHFRDFN
jgi:hypothetical protein